MVVSAVLADLCRLIAGFQPFPDLSKRENAKALLIKIGPDLVDLAYDVGGIDALAKCLCGATPSDVDGAIRLLADSGDLGKFGDGAFIKNLIANLPQLITSFMQIWGLISNLIPKTMPAPGPVNPPTPPVQTA